MISEKNQMKKRKIVIISGIFLEISGFPSMLLISLLFSGKEIQS